VLSRLREAMGQQAQPGDLIDQLFRRYGEGFYMYAKPRVKQGEGISRYIGRYVRHPAIADSRIIADDGQTVTYPSATNSSRATTCSVSFLLSQVALGVFLII